MVSKKQTQQPKAKLIDILEKALKDAGYNVERDGWHETIDKDWCEWLDVVDNIVDNTQRTIHFYFVNNASKLQDINVFKTEFELMEKDTQRLFQFKNAAKIAEERELEAKRLKAEETKKNAPKGYTPIYC